MNIPFSQRYGYIKPENVFIRESFTGSILNSTYNFIQNLFHEQYIPYDYSDLHGELWLKVLNLRIDQMGPSITDLILDERNPWYERIDHLEWLINYIRSYINDTNKGFTPVYVMNCNNALDRHLLWLNSEFERHNYAYRIINDVFIETTSSSEMAVIQESLAEADANSVTHLQESLKLLSPSNQELSTRNAIKEAISAVEVTARQITNASTLDEAFKKLRDIHPMIKLSIEKLYHYTNQKDTGIRHGWMEQSDEPTINEAIFVLVTSCSFINYLNKVYCNSEHK